MMGSRWLAALVPAALILALAGLLLRPEEGPDAMPFFYPLVAIAAVVVVVAAVRLLGGLLRRDRDYYDAD